MTDFFFHFFFSLSLFTLPLLYLVSLSPLDHQPPPHRFTATITHRKTSTIHRPSHLHCTTSAVSAALSPKVRPISSSSLLSPCGCSIGAGCLRWLPFVLDLLNGLWFAVFSGSEKRCIRRCHGRENRCTLMLSSLSSFNVASGCSGVTVVSSCGGGAV